MIGAFPFEEELKTLFCDQMDRQTSAYLYGSAATGNWVPTRSDLDLLILVPEEKLGLLGEKIKLWRANNGHTILDGFALFSSYNVPMAKRLEEFHLPARPAAGEIQIIDLWNIKHRSKHLFGDDFVKGFPDISLKQLSEWARRELRNAFGPSHNRDIPRVDVVLSKLIWSVSWSARMLMLARGRMCDSKREALTWLAHEYAEIREPVGLLLDDYSKSDEEPISITANRSMALRKFCFGLMLREIETQGKNDGK
jgi:hypothetical protein